MTATKSSKGQETEPAVAVKASRPVSILRFLASVRLAIVVLSLIAATSVVGTVIKQGGTQEEYLALYPEKTYHLIKLFGLDDAYHSPWFFFLIALFAVNLALCTFQRIKRLAGERSTKGRSAPNVKALVAAGSGFTLGAQSRDEIARRLEASYGKSRATGAAVFYEKGSLSRYGVLVIHASVLVVLLGGLMGLVAGHKGFIMLRVGEETDSAISRKRAGSVIPLGFKVRCKDFRVSFYPGGEPKEYASDIEIVGDAGEVVREGKIRVNEPLSYGGMWFYQSTYGKSNLYTFLVDGRKVVLGEQEVYNKAEAPFMVVRYAAQVHDFGPGVMVAYMDGEEPKTVWFLRDVERMRTQKVLGSRITLEKIDGQYYTGLEVSRDPGVPVVLSGFGLMLLGLYINFFTFHRRIYVADEGNSVSIAGLASRNKEALLEELKKLTEGLG